MMEKEFIPYEQALKLEELGFDEKNILAYYTIEDKRLVNGYSLSTNGFELNAPTFSQAFRWFREKYDICPSIEKISEEIYHRRERVYEFRWGAWGYTSKNYEEAELACLNRLIEIVESNKE